MMRAVTVGVVPPERTVKFARAAMTGTSIPGDGARICGVLMSDALVAKGTKFVPSREPSKTQAELLGAPVDVSCIATRLGVPKVITAPTCATIAVSKLD